jgi:hypothetical protein
MRTQPLQKNCNRFGQQKEMNTRTPKAASSKASSLRTAGHSYAPPLTESLTTESGVERSTSTWHGPLISLDGPSQEERCSVEHGCQTDMTETPTSRYTYPPPPALPTPHRYPNFPEELAQMIVTMSDSRENEELAEAFREASDLPPITRQSLSELDIQHIIANIRLRHDVNFDRDLSFRPNLDGTKGQQKKQANGQYWKALEAELELYARLFQGTPPPSRRGGSHWAGLTQNAKRRIPVIFQTIQEVLKSLVPDRDHARVDEHLDVPMLMQEIERGVCDLVRLAEWMAQLLKEHCAPMRDSMVDGMVAITREGVNMHSLSRIVEGLRELLGILETMKLVSCVLMQTVLMLTSLKDVANHQIRNLKTLLIEDIINFEKQYHLDRLVSHRSRVNVDTAQAWYLHATRDFANPCPNPRKNVWHARLEIFVRAVVAQLFNRNGRDDFPETFYLDQDRLRSLKVEIEDLIYMEVCMAVFRAFLKQFGFVGSVPPLVRHQLHTSLLAIMGETMGYGSRQWVMNSEALSLEILRQASLVAGQPGTFTHDTLSSANEHLVHMFYNSCTTHNPRLEKILLHRVLTCTDRNINATPMELFNNLVPLTNSIIPPATHFSHLQTAHTSSSSHTLNQETTKWQDITNRITHIIILHWRVWDRIAYLQEDDSEQARASASQDSTTLPPLPVLSAQPPEHEAHVVTAMKTGESLDQGQETLVSHETPSQ